MEGVSCLDVAAQQLWLESSKGQQWFGTRIVTEFVLSTAGTFWVYYHWVCKASRLQMAKNLPV